MKSFLKGMLAAVPIVIGYLPIALAYGVIATEAGLTVGEITMMSVFVFGGASQFMIVNMMLASSLYIEIILATFVLNFRHFVMSFAMMHRLKEAPFFVKLILGAQTTDESFSFFSLSDVDEDRDYHFFLGLFMAGYLAWVFGSLLGGFVGLLIPAKLGISFGVSLYAMFIALLVPAVKKAMRYLWIAVLAMVLNYSFSLVINSGFSLILATLLASTLNVFKKGEV